MSNRGGFLTREDLGIVRIREVPPLRGSYRETEVLVIPFPSMGGAVIEALNILERYPSDFLDQDTAERHQVMAETFHIAMTDHQRLLGSRSFAADQARRELLTKEFAQQRVSLIEIGKPVVTDEFPSIQKTKVDDGHTTQISEIGRAHV